MGKCEGCGKEINDKYKMCLECLNKAKQLNNIDSKAIYELLEKANWNWGISAKLGKLTLLNSLENLKNEKGLTEIQKRIHKWLLDDFEKDFKAVEGITKDQNGTEQSN